LTFLYSYFFNNPHFARYEVNNERLLTAARLIAPVIDDKGDMEKGYKWIMEQLRTDHEKVASKLEIDLSMAYMKQRKFDEAVEVLKAFERKDPALRAMAGTNLSFIYFLEGWLEKSHTLQCRRHT